MLNYWEFSGEVIKIRESDSEDIGATLLLKGAATRPNSESTQIVEFIISVPPKLWERLCNEGIRPYSVLEAKGHFETSVRASDINIRTSTRYFVDEAQIVKR